MPDKLSKIKALMEAVNEDTVTTKQFGDSFSSLMKFLVKIRSELFAEVVRLMGTVTSKNESEWSKIKQDISSLKEGKKGDKGDKGESVVGPIGPTGPMGLKGDKGADGSPDTPAQVRYKLEVLKGDDRLDKSAIRGLDEELKKISEVKASAGSSNYGISGGARGRIHYYDLTSQCNGVLKVFAIPSNFGILGVFSTQFPINYRPIVDWTAGDQTLTLTAQVSAPETGQTLWIAYVK